MVVEVTLFELFLTVPPVFVVRSSLGYFSVIWNLYIYIYIVTSVWVRYLIFHILMKTGLICTICKKIKIIVDFT